MRRLSLGLATALLMALTAAPAHAGKLTLTWTDASTNEAGFDIERCQVVAPAATCANFVASPPLASVGANVTQYVDLAVAERSAYCYRLRARSGADVSDYSNTGWGTVAVVIPPPSNLTVAKLGGGSGAVTSVPTWIACGPRCSARVPPGAVVTLRASPAAASRFEVWGGACRGVAPQCQVAVNGFDRVVVSARFSVRAPPPDPGAGFVR